jgi:CRP/FNR family transcriptional regulator, dissimilatory nitrate respiration regulator
VNAAAIIHRSMLFAGLSDEDVTRIASITSNRSFKRGQTIFAEGEMASAFYLVVYGRVKVFKVSTEGREQVLHIIDVSEPFGEVPVFSGDRFPANAAALEDCQTLVFPRSAFLELLKQEPSLAMNMLGLLSKRLLRFARLVEELSLKEVPARLASYLLYLRDKAGGGSEVELDIPKNVLSALLGSVPETVSRVLNRMATEGLIGVEGRRITICDLKGMEDYSSGAKV